MLDTMDIVLLLHLLESKELYTCATKGGITIAKAKGKILISLDVNKILVL
jgi:hypothetical protein